MATLLTKQQQNALLALPSDGSWLCDPGRETGCTFGPALVRRGLIEIERGEYFNARSKTRVRLTAAGVRWCQPTGANHG